MIISLSGLIGSGKDTVADMLITNHGFKQLAFAGAVKDVVSIIFGWDRNRLEGITPEDRVWRETVDPWWANRLNIPELSPRWVLQNFGTDTVKNHFHNEIWIAVVENKIQMMKDSNIVISDARFIDELTVLSNVGAKTVRVSRGTLPSWWIDAAIAQNDEYAMNRMMCSHIHRSEWDHCSFNFDLTIHNDGTLEELENQVKLLVS